jgi:hypothetical protein
VTKHAQAAAAEALEASKEANDRHNCLRELVIKLQRSHERTCSQRSLAESQAVPDPAMEDQQSNSMDEGHSLSDTNHRERVQDGKTNEPVSSSVVMLAWIAQAKLPNQWVMTTQCVGQLYEANADPAVLNKAVARA